MPFTQRHNQQHGFTLVEVLVIAPIVILLIGTFVGAIIYLTGEVLAARAQNNMVYEVQDALETIQEDVRLSGAFLAKNNITLVSPQGYNNSTQAFESTPSSTPTSTGSKLILNTLGTTENPETPTRKLVYLANEPNGCSSAQLQQNQIYTVNVVYFVKDNALWRRTIAPNGYTNSGVLCGSPWQLPSCATTSNAFCKTRDMKLVSGITPSDFTLEYYSNPQASNANTAAQSTNETTRQDALDETTTVRITIRGASTVAGRDIEQTGTIRATRAGGHMNSANPVLPLP